MTGGILVAMDATPMTDGTPPPRAPDFTLEPSGPFSLRESAEFGFGQRSGISFDAAMPLAFCVDGYRSQVGVEVRQDGHGVHGWVQTDPADGEVGMDAVGAQVARVLSLDHDGETFAAIGRRDPVIAGLQAVAPGLRPPLFYSPYEAAAWSVLSARRPARQMAEVRRRLSAAHGRTFEIAGRAEHAFPTPTQLLAVGAFAGIPQVKLDRLHGVATAAEDGRLDAATLRATDPTDAIGQLRRIDGIGPFYASLVLIRATGLADILPESEPRLLALVQRLYGLAHPPEPAELAAIAEPWRPLRTWCAVLIRAATGRMGPATAD